MRQLGGRIVQKKKPVAKTDRELAIDKMACFIAGMAMGEIAARRQISEEQGCKHIMVIAESFGLTDWESSQEQTWCDRAERILDRINKAIKRYGDA
jgi:hypothetical protein